MGASWFEAANERPGVPTPLDAAERPEQTIRRQAVEIERLTRRVDELRPLAAHGVRNPPEDAERLLVAARAVTAAWTSDDVFAVEERGTALVDALGDLVELIEGDR